MNHQYKNCSSPAHIFAHWFHFHSSAVVLQIKIGLRRNMAHVCFLFITCAQTGFCGVEAWQKIKLCGENVLFSAHTITLSLCSWSLEASINVRNTWLADGNVDLWTVVYVDGTQRAEKLDLRRQNVVKMKSGLLRVLIFLSILSILRSSDVQTSCLTFVWHLSGFMKDF